MIGVVSHYYNQIGVAVIELTQGELRVGDEIEIERGTESVRQKVKSMQYEHEAIEVARAGQSIGLKVDTVVSEHNTVYKLV